MQELENGDPDEAKAIAGDIKDNLQKIILHGKRADNIVKGMLEHSRSSSGTFKPTNLHLLIDEYIKLAFHGFRVKDQSFQAELVNERDSGIGKINAAPQDLGRVLLNLFNNAFYAVKEKQQNNGQSDYKPTIIVSTHRLEDFVEIRVRDNGTGISEHVRQKIFQPFFTTKPTGQGTGLGLSISYDIVTKGHGGTLAVESEMGVGTVFILRLPV